MANPNAVNRRKYARAQEYIRIGAWVVDPDAGVIHSRRTGKPLRGKVQRGYLHYGVTLPGGSRDTAHCIPVRAARVIWESVHGPIPDGYEVNHKDGTKLNNSISNFELTTGAENKEHARRTGLWKPLSGEQAGSARLTESQVREIQTLLAQGLSQAAIGRRYGVAQTTVSHINRAKSWRQADCLEGFQPSVIDGPLRGELNGAARLTDQDVAKIRDLLSRGVYQRVIAERFNISQSTVSLIKLGKVWAHVGAEVECEQPPSSPDQRVAV